MKPNWQTKRLSEVCDIQKIKYNKGDLPYVGMEDIEPDTGNFIGSLAPKKVKSLTFYFDSEHILYGRLRPYLNKVLMPSFNGHCSTEIFPIKVNNDLDKNYLYYWLTYDEVVKRINATCTGARMPRANMKDVMDFEIPLPPLPEQHRIVKILDEVFADVAKAKENAKKNLQNAKEIFESYLQSVFANQGKDWEEKRLGDVCEEVLAGGDKPKDAFSKYKTDTFQIPIFSNGIKKDGLYGYTNITRIKKPSITISARGTIGYSVIRRESFFPIIRLIVLTPDDDLIDLNFLHYSIKNNSIIGNGTSIPQLTVPAVKKIKISFPKSLTEQKSIVAKLDALSAETKKLEEIYRQKLGDLEELKKSVLKKVFSGEL